MPSTTVALPKMIDIVPRVTVMPIEPMINNGLRPNLSMEAIAIRVVRMLIVAPMTVMANACSSWKPTASQRMLE